MNFDPVSRRLFLRRAALALPAMHFGLGYAVGEAETPSGINANPHPPVRYRKIRLLTDRLDEQRLFYSEKLGFPLVETEPDTFSIRAGRSILQFVQAGEVEMPFYHFAFSISENKLESAKRWLNTRTPVLRQSSTGKDVIHFWRWNAHAIYFLDPAGNIGEFIAHHTLDTASAGEFGIEDVLYLSEIGLVVPDVGSTVSELQAGLNIKDVPGASINFAAVGDAHGYFIVVKQDRIWLPTDDIAARPFPVVATLEGGTKNGDDATIEGDSLGDFSLSSGPFVVRRAAPG